jgi:CheY-like chemotaxis protein
LIRNFFLADDDRDDTDLFGEALRKIDTRIVFRSAANGKELIEQLHVTKEKPEIIFLDINMPELDGWESLKTLKRNENLREIPVVMYSTSSAFLDGNRAIKEGAVCYLEKPFSFVKLKEFLQELTFSSKDELIETLKTIEASKKHNIVVA